MVRSFEEWWNTLPSELRAKVRKGDEKNKPLLNQINYVCVHNMMQGKSELNPSAEELLHWVSTGQVDAMRAKK